MALQPALLPAGGLRLAGHAVGWPLLRGARGAGPFAAGEGPGPRSWRQARPGARRGIECCARRKGRSGSRKARLLGEDDDEAVDAALEQLFAQLAQDLQLEDPGGEGAGRGGLDIGGEELSEEEMLQLERELDEILSADPGLAEELQDEILSADPGLAEELQEEMLDGDRGPQPREQAGGRGFSARSGRSQDGLTESGREEAALEDAETWKKESSSPVQEVAPEASGGWMEVGPTSSVLNLPAAGEVLESSSACSTEVGRGGTSLAAQHTAAEPTSSGNVAQLGLAPAGNGAGEDPFRNGPAAPSSGTASNGATRQVFLQPWQVKKLVKALHQGRRHVNVKALAAELHMDRRDVLAWLRRPPADALRMAKMGDPQGEPKDSKAQGPGVAGTFSGTSAATVTPALSSALAAQGLLAGGFDDPASSPKAGEDAPGDERWDRRGKRIRKEQLATLEAVFERTQYPTGAMVANLVTLTNLPKRRILQWFAERREAVNKGQSRASRYSVWRAR